MDLTIILSILGLAATVVFGFLSIDLFKKRKNPGKLTLVKQSSIGLFDNIAKNFEEISILYKGEAIKANVIYIKASIINDGYIDIDVNKVEKTLHLKLSSGLKWIKSKVTQVSPDLICSNEIKDNDSSLAFNFGLVRKKEFFQFEALIETENSHYDVDSIFDDINISHRIANTQKVNQISLLSEEQIVKKKKRIKNVLTTFGSQMLVLIVIMGIQMFYFKEAPIHYKSSEGIIYKAEANSNKNIELENTLTGEELKISIDEFQKPGEYVPFIPDQTFWEKLERMVYMIPLLFILIGILMLMEYLDLQKSNRLYNIFSKATEK